MNVYIVIVKDEFGVTREFRVSQNQLVEYINLLLLDVGQQLTAVIKL